jgi:hypothetical protein
VNEEKLLGFTLFSPTYDLRSAFVRGGLDVAHPIGGGFDDIDDKFFERVLYSCEFGANLVVSTIQTLIKNGWSEINYKEEQVGHSIEG